MGLLSLVMDTVTKHGTPSGTDAGNIPFGSGVHWIFWYSNRI